MTSSSTTTVVTGGGSGMGRDVALSLARDGHHVTVAGRRRAALDAVAEQAPEGRVAVLAADLATAEGASALARHVGDRGVLGVVAAAGGQGDFLAPAADAHQAERNWTEALRKNLMSAVLPIEALTPSIADARGRVVLISSTSALDGRGGAYATAKAALQGYGRDLAIRLGPRGITVNSVAPGFVGDTEFFVSGGIPVDDAMTRYAAAATLVGRVGRVSDVTACVRWLLSEDAGWTTGQVISPNGGQVMVGS